MARIDDVNLDELVQKVVAKLAPALGIDGFGPVTNPRATPSPG